jgi:starch-binding outer membrane protein, SusD/RagB family
MKTFIIHLYKYLLGACLVVSISGCADNFLDREPISDISPEVYLKDESQLAAYAINQYNFPQAGTTTPYEMDAHTDNQNMRYSDSRWLPGQWKVGQSGGSWDFSSIYKLNYFLNTVVPRFESNEITGNATNVKHYLGEVYFLRAYEYFNRLKQLGDFPIITEILSDSKEVLVEASKRRPRNEVTRFILEDLTKACDLMSNTPPGGRNRLTKNTAYLLKSRVALYEATWLKYHKGTALVPQGQGWPGAEKDYNKGYQYPSGNIDAEINYFLDQAMAASKVVADAVTLATNSLLIKEISTTPKNDYFEMFNQENLNAYSEILFWRSFNLSLGISHPYFGTFADGGSNGYTRQFVDNFLMQDGMPVYASSASLPYKGDDYVQDVKVNRDWRLRLFMRAPGEKKIFFNNGVAVTPLSEPVAPTVYNPGGAGNCSATGYDIKKGLSYDVKNRANYGVDVSAIPIFRAAEAYLNYIEACYERTGALDGSADKYWKAIRTRAGINPDYNVTIVATNMTKESLNDWGAYSHGKTIDATLYNIRRERRCEFIAEGFRMDDLRRWRALDQVKNYQIEGLKCWGPMKDLIISGTKKYSDYFMDSKSVTGHVVSVPELGTYFRVNQIVPKGNGNLYYDGYNWNEAHYLNPIAIDHFLYTTSDGATISTSPLYQNPGWPTVADQGPIGVN